MKRNITNALPVVGLIIMAGSVVVGLTIYAFAGGSESLARATMTLLGIGMLLTFLPLLFDGNE